MCGCPLVKFVDSLTSFKEHLVKSVSFSWKMPASYNCENLWNHWLQVTLCGTRIPNSDVFINWCSTSWWADECGTVLSANTIAILKNGRLSNQQKMMLVFHHGKDVTKILPSEQITKTLSLPSDFPKPCSFLFIFDFY